MTFKWHRVVFCAGISLALSAPAWAGGAWVPGKGQGDVQLGYSVKTANTSWDSRGNTRVSSSWHIFRYAYAGGEVGVIDDLSFRFLLTYLDGLEGRRGDMEHNAGPSESYLGLKYQVHEGTWPMAVALTARLSYLYDLPGDYDRHLFLEGDTDDPGDEDAVFKGVSPEWRGLLGEDYTLSFLISRSLFEGGWMNLEAGYSYRTTNLADEIPLYAEVGYPLPWQDLIAKGTLTWVQSVGNDDPRKPTDRFGCSVANCFPDASRIVAGASLFRDFGEEDRWWGEIGYNQFVWGRSTRKYEEPYFSLGRRF